MGLAHGAILLPILWKTQPLAVLKFLALLLKRRTPLDLGLAQRRTTTPSIAEDAGASAHLFVMRHVVLNRDKKVVGYAFFQPDVSHLAQVDAESDRSFLAFLASVTTNAALGGRRAMVTVTARLLFNAALEKLAGNGVAVLVHLDASIDNFAPVIERMQALHKRGLLVGLADGRLALSHPELGHCVSLAGLQVDHILTPDLLDMVRLFRNQHPQIQLIACGVNSYEAFEVCRKLRMHGFTGPFVTHRRDWQNNPIDPGTLRLCKLVNSLRADLELDAIIDEIKLDPLLSFRILCYANSAALGAEHRILTLKDAIMLIGREPLFRWLVLLLCASAPSQLHSSALLENALVRGRMMEILSQDVATSAPQDCFLTGVLSLLDVILEVPASTLLGALDLPSEVKAALQDRTGPYAGLLRLAEAVEQTQAEDVRDLCTDLGIETGQLSHAHNAALMWARGENNDRSDGAVDTTFLCTPPVAVERQSAAPAPNSLPVHHAVAVAPDNPTPKPVQTRPASAPPILDASEPVDPEAQTQLAARYAAGDGVPKDMAQALTWYTRAAEQGSAKAQWNVAVMHARGLGGTEKDEQRAARWHLKSAAQGFAPSQAALGLMYAGGLGVKKDASKAVALLQLAAMQGDMEAQYNLATMHEQGLDGEVNSAEAVAWFTQAADQGLPMAQDKLGVMYAVGQSVQQDLIEAYKWFFLACNGNLDSAKTNLAHCQDLLDTEQVAQAQSRAEGWMQDHAANH